MVCFILKETDMPLAGIDERGANKKTKVMAAEIDRTIADQFDAFAERTGHLKGRLVATAIQLIQCADPSVVRAIMAGDGDRLQTLLNGPQAAPWDIGPLQPQGATELASAGSSQE